MKLLVSILNNNLINHLDFPLSRRESTVAPLDEPLSKRNSTENNQIPSLLGKRQGPPLINKSWMDQVKQRHQEFQIPQHQAKVSIEISDLEESKSAGKLSKNNSNIEPTSNQPQHLFSEEQDPIKQLIKKIMYAEGDLISLQDECAQYLKDALQSL